MAVSIAKTIYFFTGVSGVQQTRVPGFDTTHLSKVEVLKLFGERFIL